MQLLVTQFLAPTAPVLVWGVVVLLTLVVLPIIDAARQRRIWWIIAVVVFAPIAGAVWWLVRLDEFLAQRRSALV